MDHSAMERSLSRIDAGILLVDPRLVRRVITRHRNLSGLGLHVPHARCYTIGRDALLGIIDGPKELGRPVETLPPELILLASPRPDELLGKGPPEVLQELWRVLFHARVHQQIERRLSDKTLTDAMIRERIDRIGQIEFDEVRMILRQDDMLLPPHDNREAYAEFAALYLELSHFAPGLVERTFPALRDRSRVEAVLLGDIDARSLLDRSRPEGAVAPAARVQTTRQTTTPTFSTAPTMLFSLPFLQASAPSAGDVPRLFALAGAARAKGNVVRAALLCLGAATAAGSDEQVKLHAAARADMDKLSERLSAVLRAPGEQGSDKPGLQWTSLLWMLAERAGPRRGIRYPIEVRLLYDLQNACAAGEEEVRAVDLATWALSFGRRPIVRPLPVTREVRIFRHIRSAALKLRHVRIAPTERKLLGRVLHWARDQAEQNVRSTLRPPIEAALAAVDLKPQNLPEHTAQHKLVEELLDHVVARGFLTIGHLRDSLSRNQLKLADLRARELATGDALLKADRVLGESLDGVYRPSEVYLRVLQKLSSLAFGTPVGRFLTLYLILPWGGAFVLLEGVSHLIGPILQALGFAAVPFLTVPSFAVTGLVVLALLHSEVLRFLAKRALGFVGRILSMLLLDLPRWILTRPIVRRMLESQAAGAFNRYVLVPLVLTVILYFITPLRRGSPLIGYAGAGMIFAGFNVLLNSHGGRLLEQIALEWLLRTWRMLRRKILPGLFRFVVDTFRMLIELLERGLYRVEEWLRFRQGEHRFTVGLKAALGLVWFFVAYLIRIYVNLLIEPEINPVKHFPVVTVAHKILLPFSPAVLHVLQSALLPIGPFIANAIAGPTVFLLPSVFGFLVWEFKENFRLYGANRPRFLGATPVGQHGETVGTLMKLGFHSGTLPKLYTKLRRAARREEGLSFTEARAEGAVGRYREALHEVEQGVRRFVTRELGGLLTTVRRWRFGPIEVARITLGSNRMRIELVCKALSRESCDVVFEEQSGFLVASIPRPGWLDAVTGEATLVVENAIAGLYHRSGVDLVREQLEWALQGDRHYDISDEGLVVWPGETYRTEVVYALDPDGYGAVVKPMVRGEPPERPPQPLDGRTILYRTQKITWADWVNAWDASRPEREAVPRLVRGASILPHRTEALKAAG
jgi:hypothetical protein